MRYTPTVKFALAIFLVACVGVAVSYVLRSQRHRAAERILNKMAAVYMNCKSYQDSGTAQLISERFGATLQFTTAFVRPDRFRYEYMDRVKNNHLIIWRKGKNVTFWFSIPNDLPTPKSFDLAIATATGVSIGTTHTIPALLFSKGQISGWRLTDMVNATQVEDAITENVDCFRVKGQVAAFNTVVWIDKSTFLVRRIEGISEHGVKTFVSYNPSVNIKVPDTELEYNIRP